MAEKAYQATAFLSWYRSTSLPEVMFALTQHAWTDCCSFKKKIKKKDLMQGIF
jgi:hypothetical protein